MFIGRQSDTAQDLAAVEIEGITVDIKCTVILGAVTREPIRHDDSLGLALVTALLIPVAEALRDRRRCTIGVGDRKYLRLLAAFHARGEKVETAELALRKRDGSTRDRIRCIRWSKSEQHAIPQGCRTKRFLRIGKAFAVGAGRRSELRAVGINAT